MSSISSKFQDFTTKARLAFQQKKFESNQNQIEKTLNLAKRKELIEENLKILQNFPEISSPGKETSHKQALDETLAEIKIKNEEIKNKITTFLDILTLDQYKEPLEHFKQVEDEVKKVGLIDWINLLKLLQDSAKANLDLVDILTSIERRGILNYQNEELQKVVWNLEKHLQEAVELSTQSFSKEILERWGWAQSLSPTNLEKTERIQNEIRKLFTERGLNYAPPSLKTKMLYRLGDVKEKVGSKAKSVKFNHLVASGKKNLNLIEAKETFQKALEMIEHEPYTYLPEVKEEIESEINGIDQKITTLTEDRDQLLNKATEYMYQFQPNPALQLLYPIVLKLKENGLFQLKDQVEEKIAIFEYNNTNLQQILQIETTFTQQNYLGSFQAAQKLKHKLSQDQDAGTILPSYRNRFETIHQKIIDQLKTIEIDLQKEIRSFETEVRDQLNFEKILPILRSKKQMAEDFGLTEVQLLANKTIEVCDQNAQISKKGKRILSAVGSEDIASLQNEMENLSTQVLGPQMAFYPKIVEAQLDNKKKFETTVAQFRTQFQDRLNAIKSKLMESHDLDAARYAILLLQSDIEKAGFNDLLPKLALILDQININQQIINELQKMDNVIQINDFDNARKYLPTIQRIGNENDTKVFDFIKNMITEHENQVNNQTKETKSQFEVELKDITNIFKNNLDINEAKKHIFDLKRRSETFGDVGIIEKVSQFDALFEKNIQIIADFNLYREKMQLGFIIYAHESLNRLLNVCALSPGIYFPTLITKIQTLLSQIEKETNQNQQEIENGMLQIESTPPDQIQLDLVLDKLDTYVRLAQKYGLALVEKTAKEKFVSFQQNKKISKELSFIAEKYRQGELAKAKEDLQKLISQLNPAIPLISAVETQKQKLTEMLETELRVQINHLSDDLVPVQKLVEELQKYDEAIKPLREFKIKAEKLGSQNLLQEINELIIECNKHIAMTPPTFFRSSRVIRNTSDTSSNSTDTNPSSESEHTHLPINTNEVTMAKNSNVKLKKSTSSLPPAQKKKCPDCGVDQPPNSLICLFCGKSLK